MFLIDHIYLFDKKKERNIKYKFPFLYTSIIIIFTEKYI